MEKCVKVNLSHARLILILLLISYFFLMFGNSIISLTHPDEVFYVQTAKEMMAHKSWATPYIFDQPQFEKPVFFYWLLIISIKLFGPTAFAMRFWPASFGMLGVLLTYWLSFMLFGNKRQAFLSGLVLSTSLIYIALSRAVLTDMVFSIWVFLALVFFYWAYSNPTKKHIGIILWFATSGVAVLTKGILGFIFPFGAAALFLLYKRDSKFLKSKATVFGFLIFLALCVPWHILMLKLYGQEFIKEYWHNVHLRRIFDAEHQKSNTWYFYPMTMFGGIFPWSFFSLPALYLAFLKLKKNEPEKDKFVFLLLWMALVIFIMQVAQSKLASYIFPVFPCLAILMGYYFLHILETKKDVFFSRSFKVISYLMGLVTFGACIAALIARQKYSMFITDPTSVYVFSVLIILCSLAIYFFNRRREILKTILSVACISLSMLVAIFFGYRFAEPWVSCKEICDVFKKMDETSTVVLCSKFYVRGVRFYTDRETAVIDINGEGFFSPHPIPFLNNDQKVHEFLNSQALTYAIVKESNVKDLQRIANQFGYAVTHFDSIGGKHILRFEKKRS